MVKNRYYGNEGLSLAWYLGVIFLDIPNLRFGEVKKNIWSFGSKGDIEKSVSCFVVYPFLLPDEKFGFAIESSQTSLWHSITTLSSLVAIGLLQMEIRSI